MTEKTQIAGGDGQSEPENKPRLCVCGKPHPTQRGAERYTSRVAIDTVHEVIGVGETHDPQERDDNADNAELQIAKHGNGNDLEIAHTPYGCDRNNTLNHEAKNCR